MKRRISQWSVSKKTLVWLTVFIILPLLAAGGLLFWRNSRQKEETERRLTAERMDYVMQNLETQLRTVSQIARDLSLNEYIYDIAVKDLDSRKHYESWKYLDASTQYNDFLVKIQILRDGKVIWQQGARTGYAFSEDGSEAYALPIQAGEKAAAWSAAHVLPRLSGGKFVDSMYLVSYYCGIYDLKSMEPRGVLAVHTEEASVRNLYENFLYGDVEDAWIVLEDGRLMSATREEWLRTEIPQEYRILEDAGEEGSRTGAFGRLFWKKSQVFGGYLVQVNREASVVRGYLSLAVPVLLFFGFLYAGYAFFYRIYVVRPLERLTRQMEKAKNLDLKQERIPAQGDEIGVLTTTFQSMLEHIDELIRKVYVEKIKTQEAERETMLAQMNPHFLYNTLDSIRWNALSHGEKEVARQLEALSLMLRSTLNFGKKDTSIRQEMQLIENYLFLLKARFRDEIQVEIQADPLVLDCSVAKLLIQPLVENAYKHGLENKLGQKKIWIKIHRRCQELRIYVADNGAGCRQEEVEERLQNEDSRDCFALKNIRDRLELSYGSQARLRFFSREGRGTLVRLTIPLKKEF